MPDAPAKKSKLQTFRERLLSTLVLWGMMIAAFVVGDTWIFYLIFLFMQTIGTIEFFRLFEMDGEKRFLGATLVAGWIYTAVSYCGSIGMELPIIGSINELVIVFVVMALITMQLRSHVEKGGGLMRKMAVSIFALAYLTVMFGFTLKILDMPGLTNEEGERTGHVYLMFLFAVTKFTDMGAYAIGSLIGKHKMIPKISPGKTWEGFGGAIGSAVLAAFICLWTVGENIPLITPVHAVVLGIGLALFAIVGDLAESIIKRSTATKDSGHVMPGIGGIMDLVDSVLFTGPALYVYLLFLR